MAAWTYRDLLYGIFEPKPGKEIDGRPEVPELDPFLGLVVDLEGRLAKDDAGVILDTCLDAQLARRRITDRAEILIWEDLILTYSREVRVVNARRMEDLQQPRDAAAGSDNEDDD